MSAASVITTGNQVLRALAAHPAKRGGDQALRRLTALYQDPDVVALLQRHRIPARPAAGTITERFPTPRSARFNRNAGVAQLRHESHAARRGVRTGSRGGCR